MKQLNQTTRKGIHSIQKSNQNIRLNKYLSKSQKYSIYCKDNKISHISITI